MLFCNQRQMRQIILFNYKFLIGNQEDDVTPKLPSSTLSFRANSSNWDKNVAKLFFHQFILACLLFVSSIFLLTKIPFETFYTKPQKIKINDIVWKSYFRFCLSHLQLLLATRFWIWSFGFIVRLIYWKLGLICIHQIVTHIWWRFLKI